MSGSAVTWQTVAVGLTLIVAINAGLFLIYRYVSKRLLNGPAEVPPHASPIFQALAQEVDDLKEQVSLLRAEVQQAKAVKPAISPYNQALHMAKQGFAAIDVARSCGISRGEAELIIALYRKSKLKGVE